MKSFFATAALAALFLGGCAVEPYPHYRLPAATPPLTVGEISRLSKAGVPDSVIVDEIKSRGIGARPSADEIVALKKEGLSDAVLQSVSVAVVRPVEPIAVEEVWGYPGYDPYYYPYFYGAYWYGWPYWTWHYSYPYCYPYSGWRVHGYGASVHRYRP